MAIHGIYDEDVNRSSKMVYHHNTVSTGDTVCFSCFSDLWITPKTVILRSLLQNAKENVTLSGYHIPFILCSTFFKVAAFEEIDLHCFQYFFAMLYLPCFQILCTSRI